MADTKVKAGDVGLDLGPIEAPASLAEMAYRALKDSLLKMDLDKVPEEGRLDERELAERLGVSRTPLREAINRLEAEGFLRVIPRKGVYIVRKSKQEIVEILLVRSALEGLAARLATENISDSDIRQMRRIFEGFKKETLERQFLRYSEANVRFHEMVLQLSGCGKLIELAGNLFDHIQWIRRRTAIFSERLEKSLKEHLQIIEAFEARDPALAETRMRTHIEDLARYVESKVEILP
jgi:DNA-binding GntR family transcriptional regulator